MMQILHYSDNDFPSLHRPKSNSSADSRHSKPVDGVKSRKIVGDRKSKQSCVDVTSSKTDRNCELKVLQPNEHKETYSININDALTKTLMKDQVSRTRPNKIKCSTRNDDLCGNSLDADHPIRRRGKFGLPKKPKRVSKTKKSVLDYRENVLKAEELAKEVVVENEKIFYNSDFQNEDLVNILYSAKLPEVRKSLKCLGERRQENYTDSAFTQENESSTSDEKLGNVIDVCDAMKFSIIPPHLLLLHSHNFKRYCDNWITNDLNNAVDALVSQIVRFQRNKYQKNPMKAIADKRFVLGFKQTIKYTRMNKTKLVICVPDMEDGMLDMVNELMSLASTYCIPHVFALTRRKLGFLTCKKVGVSCLGLLDCSSAEDNLNRVIEAGMISKRIYEEKCSAAVEYCQLHLNNSSLEENQNESSGDAELRDITKKIGEKLLLKEDENCKN